MVKVLKIGTSRTICIIVLKMGQFGMYQKDIAGMANNVDPDQTAPFGLHFLLSFI